MDNDRQASKPTAVIVALIALAMMTVPTASAGFGGIVLPPLPPLPPFPTILPEQGPQDDLCEPNEYGKCIHLIVELEYAMDPISDTEMVRARAKLYSYARDGGAIGEVQVKMGGGDYSTAECFEPEVVDEFLLILYPAKGCWAIAQTGWHGGNYLNECAWANGFGRYYVENPNTHTSYWFYLRQDGSDCP